MNRNKLNTPLILFMLLVVSQLQAQTNRALVVAISQYPAGSGWEEIHATNDCKLILPMLKTHGYKNTNITVLLNKDAIKVRIIQELQLLEKKSQSGDCIYIHLSGHGQQMVDDNGDEPDGLDESFIPYDACFRYNPGKYEGKNHLRDDELESFIENIRRKVGKQGNVMLLLDACHSGTGTRYNEDEEYQRGTPYIFAPPNNKAVPANPQKNQLQLKKGNNLASLTVFSACQPDEANYEYKTNGNPRMYYGCLSYFFCNLAKKKESGLTNYTLYGRLKVEMSQYVEKKNRKQTPYFESTDSTQLFMVGKSSKHVTQTK